RAKPVPRNLEPSPLSHAVDGPQHRLVAVRAELVPDVQRPGQKEQSEHADDDRGDDRLAKADRAERGEEREQDDDSEAEHRERSENPAQHRPPPVTMVASEGTLRRSSTGSIPKIT